MTVTTLQAAARPRSYVSVNGQDAASYLNRMVSNEVEELDIGASCEALLLTPKARIVAPLVVLRRAQDDFLLLTEPEAGERLARELLRARFAAKCAIEAEEHRSVVVLGAAEEDFVSSLNELALPNRDYGVPAVELLDADAPEEAEPIGEHELERLRIIARTPRLGRELDDRVMPAEAGLEERTISFTKGCYPGQELVERMDARGAAAPKQLRRVHSSGGELAADLPLVVDGAQVGVITSAAGPDGLAVVGRAVEPGSTAEAAGRAVSVTALR